MERETCRGADLKPEYLAFGEIGIAMCKTPMLASTHGRSGWFNSC
jgi:hypothetical protein